MLCGNKLAGALIAALIVATSLHAESPDPEPLLDRTSVRVRGYLEQISDVRCTEHVSQLKLGPKGNTEYHEEATYDYLVLMDGSNDQFLLNESRLPQAQSHRAPKNIPMLISNGFSNLFLIFHPYYRNSFEFDMGREEVLDGKRMWVMKFRHIPGMRTPAAIAVRGREIPLDLTGEAWIDESTGMVARIQAAVAKDMTDIGLRSLKADVYYAPVQLPGWSEAYRFPSRASVEVETLRQSWRNVHQFSNYQRFTVDTQVAVSKDIDKNDTDKKDPNK
ncbi:MAG: hypothetical protein ACXVZV_09735 [Terriglobales bacterium]